jgi:hypothetical protein
MNSADILIDSGVIDETSILRATQTNDDIASIIGSPRRSEATIDSVWFSEMMEEPECETPIADSERRD